MALYVLKQKVQVTGLTPGPRAWWIVTLPSSIWDSGTGQHRWLSLAECLNHTPLWTPSTPPSGEMLLWCFGGISTHSRPSYDETYLPHAYVLAQSKSSQREHSRLKKARMCKEHLCLQSTRARSLAQTRVQCIYVSGRRYAGASSPKVTLALQYFTVQTSDVSQMAPFFLHDNVFTSSHPLSDIYRVPGQMSKGKDDKARLLRKPMQLPALAMACDGALGIARGLFCLLLFIFSVFANLALLSPEMSTH